MKFPDGRTITVVGHMHGTRQIYVLWDLINSGQMSRMTDQEFETYLKGIVKENSTPESRELTRSFRRGMIEDVKGKFQIDVSDHVKEEAGYDLEELSVLRHAREDYDFLQDLLAQSSGAGKIGFVGYEGTDEMWRNNSRILPRVKNALLLQYHVRKGRGNLSLSLEQIQDVLLSGSNANVYAYMQNPSLMTSVPMFGTEDESAGKAHEKERATEKMEDALTALDSEVDANLSALPEARRKELAASRSFGILGSELALLYIDTMNMLVESMNDFQSRAARVKELAPAAMHDALDRFFAAAQKRIQLNYDRDYASALNLAGRFQSGVHFVGLNHLRNTMRNLEQLCLRESSGLSSPARDQLGQSWNSGAGTLQ